jgi:hypothetical protein
MSFLKKLFGTKASVDSEFIVHKDKIYPWVKVVFEGDYDPRNTPVQLELDNINLPKINPGLLICRFFMLLTRAIVSGFWLRRTYQ